MRRWSRGRLDEPLSNTEVRGWERRASSWGGLAVVVAAVVWEAEAWVVGGGWDGEGSAGGVKGCEGDGGGRLAGEAILEAPDRGEVDGQRWMTGGREKVESALHQDFIVMRQPK
jgi:hypothetical protein